ncbi:MAG: ECF-type sigma factor [Phycisphaerales bacterium]
MTEHTKDQSEPSMSFVGMDSLFLQFESELRGLASKVFSEQGASHTLQPTALVNEAWLKLSGQVDAIESRQHFFALAARVMRQVLADHAKTKNAIKRGGAGHRVTFNESEISSSDAGFDLASFNESLERLDSLNRRHAEVVELRLFGMLSIPEIASLTGSSERTVKRDWQAARLWLMSELGEQ